MEPIQPPAVADLARFFPQLEILELLGHGGMGAVYKARQPGLDRLVALKILPSEASASAGFTERFTREARALARLNHPHIVTVYDFGQSQGLYYFIMEYVDGVNLRSLIRSREIKPEQALKIVPQICEALQFAHDEGIVHRDIKPENILLDKKGRVKIADFGLAKLLGRKTPETTLTGPWQVMGTFHYMAPEQLENPQAVDHRADIYALGVVFYEMLTGELPIGRFPMPSEKVQVDVRLDQVVVRALEKEPERRYQHVSEVKTDVESIAQPSQGATSPATREALGPAESESEVERVERARKTAVSAGTAVLLGLLLCWVADISPVVSLPLFWAASLIFLIAPNAYKAWQLWGTPQGRSHELIALTFLGFLCGISVLAFFPKAGVILLIAPLAHNAWRSWGTPQGRLPTLVLGLWLFLLVFTQYEPLLNWLYQRTGVRPGKGDVTAITTLGVVAVLLLLVWLVSFWVKLRREARATRALAAHPLIPAAYAPQAPASPDAGQSVTSKPAASHTARRIAWLAAQMVLGFVLVLAAIGFAAYAATRDRFVSEGFWDLIWYGCVCFFIGCCQMLAAWDQYRRLEGHPSLFYEPTWTWLDWLIATIGGVGLWGIVAAVSIRSSLGLRAASNIVGLGLLFALPSAGILIFRGLRGRRGQPSEPRRDLLQEPNWTWLDWLFGSIGIIGLLALLAGLSLSSRLPSWLCLVMELTGGLALLSGGGFLLPRGLMRRAAKQEQEGWKTATAPEPGATLRPGLGPKLLLAAIGTMGGGFLVAAAVPLLIVDFVVFPVSSGAFWSLVGGAVGCVFGGGSVLLNAWILGGTAKGANPMEAPTWNVVDTIAAGMGVLGACILLAGWIVPLPIVTGWDARQLFWQVGLLTIALAALLAGFRVKGRLDAAKKAAAPHLEE
jgi:predicted Ser/Thr protein kinase